MPDLKENTNIPDLLTSESESTTKADFTPSPAIAGVIESLAIPPASKQTAGRRRKRKKVARKRNVKARKTRKRKARRKVTRRVNRRRRRSKTSDAPKKLPPIPNIVEKTPRRILPISLINVFLFTAIFSTLVAAHIAVNFAERNKSDVLNVAPLEITAEEEVDTEKATEPAEIITQEEEPKPEDSAAEPADIVTQPQNPEDSATEPEIAVEAEEKVETEVEQKEKVVQKPRYKKRIAKKRDSYTNGGPKDLDGQAARERYLAKNKILVPKGTKDVEAYYKTKTLQDFSTEGISKPVAEKNLTDQAAPNGKKAVSTRK